MPAVGAGRENTTAQPKRKVRVKKPKPVTVAPADRVQERAVVRQKQLANSKAVNPDRQDAKRSPAQKSRDAAVVKTNVKVAAKKVASRQKSVDDAGPVKLLPQYAKSRATSKAQTVTRLAPVLKVLDQTTRPLHAVAAAAKEDVRTVKKEGLSHYLVHGTSGRGIKAAGRGIQNKDKSTFSDVFTEAGWKPKSALGKIAKGAASLTADVVADPLSYATGGTSSVAESAARTAARQAERKAVRSVPAKAAADKASQQAVKRGATPKVAKAAGKAAARTHARRAGTKAGEAAAAGKTTNRGVTVRLAGLDVPGVARGTSAAKRVPRAVARKTRLERTRPGQAVDRAQQKVRDTSRNLASDFNPAIAPAGVDRAAYQSARRSARTARAGAQRGTYRAGQRAIAFKKAIGKENYAKVIDAIEAGTIKSLPKELRSPARELEHDFAKMLKAERRAGLKIGDVTQKGRTATFPTGSTDTAASGRALSKARRAEARAQQDVEAARSAADVHQGRAEVLSRNVGGSKAEKVAERGRSKRKRRRVTVVTTTNQPLTVAARKAIARHQRKQTPKTGQRRVKVSANDAFSKRALSVEKTGGTPHLPAHEAEWFHGTPMKFEGVPTAKGRWSDLGTYMTSDPHYARGYADAAGAPRGERGHIVPLRVQPKKVLEWRAGKENPADLKRVVDSMLEQDKATFPRGNFETDMLKEWSERLGNGKALTPESSRALQELLQGVSENVGSRLGRKGTGNRHQVLADTLRGLGFDAIRKVDLHADALVVLNEGIMRRHSGVEGTPSTYGARNVETVAPKYAGGGYGVQQTATALKDAAQRLKNTAAAREAAEGTHATTVATAAEHRAAQKLQDKLDAAPPGYVKHLRIKDEPKRGGTPAVGSRKVAPSFAKGRAEGTIAEKNAREPGAYSENIPDIYLNRGAESAVARSKAKLNQSMIHAGRKPDRTRKIADQLGDNETLYKIDGANLVKVEPKSTEARNLPKGERYVILNEKLVSRTRGTVSAAAERSTSGVFFDKAQGVWKLAATQVNPGYHVRNLAGEAQNAYLAEGPITLGKNAVVAARALRQLGRDEDALRVLGAKPKEGPYTDFIRSAENVGAVRAGQLGREVGDMLGGASRKAKPAKARRGTLRKPARALKNVEDVFRLATYKGGIDRGLKPEMAMERASGNHFDYGDLTPLERKVLRRAAPFWTFSARDIPLQARTLLTNPSKFANYQKIREEFQNLFDVPDDWEKGLSESEQRSAPIPVKIHGKTYNIGLGPSGLPLTDLNEFPSAGNPVKQADEWMNRAMSMLTPAAKTPVELWANMSFFFREPIERDQGPLVPAPKWVSQIPARYRKDLGITNTYLDKRSGKTGWGAPAKLVYALNVLPGPIAFGNRVMTSSERPGQSTGAKAVGYLGPRVRQNDPLTVSINDLYQSRGKVDKKLNTLRQQVNPANGKVISAANPTPEFKKLSEQSKAMTAQIDKQRAQRGDKNLPKKKYKVRKGSGFDFGAGSQGFDFGGGSADFDFGG